MDDEHDEDKKYDLEGEFLKTWELVREDEHGSLEKTVEELVARKKKDRLKKRNVGVRLGMMRHMYVIIDMSKSMSDKEFKPNRAIVVLRYLENFIIEFFDSNPISQLGFIVTKNKRAYIISELSANCVTHLKAVEELSKEVFRTNGKCCFGDPSLYNSLEIAATTLSNMANNACKEVVYIFSSLTTVDPHSSSNLIDLAVKHKIRCNFISLTAELYVCKKLSQATNGKHGVILSQSDVGDMLKEYISPPNDGTTEPDLMKMGFPKLVAADKSGKISFCMTRKKFTIGGYYCPQCKAKYAELPVDCHICKLTLVSAPYLARSYHHLFPLPCYKEVNRKYDVNAAQECCFTCQVDLSDVCNQCDRCQQYFCTDCHVYIFDTLHSCPGCVNERCEMRPSFKNGYNNF